MKISFDRGMLSGIASAALVLALLTGCLSQLPAPVRGGPGDPDPARSGATPDGRHHIVRAGDTLLGIGRTYNQSVSDLVNWNGLENPHQIKVGQRLRIVPPDVPGTSGVAVSQPVDMPGIDSTSSPAIGVSVPRLDEPKGGRIPYSDQAWAALNPDALPPAQPVIPAPSDIPVPVPPVPAPVPAPTPAPTAKASAWLWPAAGPVIERFDETSNKGVDISGKPGDPVLASAAGSVVYAGSGLRGYGKLVIIKHNDDYLTAYAHNQTLLVKEGDTVVQGRKIAELGSTDADRPKLHFEIRRQGRPVDPMQYLPAR